MGFPGGPGCPLHGCTGSVAGTGVNVSYGLNKVQGERVEGSVFIRGPQDYHNRDIDFVGTFKGGTFSTTTPTQPGSPPVTWSLVVDASGTKMDGTASGRSVATVSVSKKK
jgi:hypothetical protein